MLKKIRFTYWFILAFIRKHFFVLAFSGLVGIASFFLLPKIFRLLPQPKPTRHIGYVGRFSLSQLPQDIQLLISDGLTSLTESGEATPSLAINWQATDSGHTYIFTLNQEKKWHNNQPITPADINYQLKDVEINKEPPDKIVFKLKEPFAPFPLIVSQPLFKEIKSPLLFLMPRKKILGSGRYQISEISYNGPFVSHLKLSSSQEKIVYKFYPTEENAILGFKLGEVDELQEVTNLHSLKNWPDLIVESTIHPNRYVALFFNNQDPHLADKRLRQALTYAIPNKETTSQRALSPINPNSWAYNPQVKPYDYSLEAAANLLNKLIEENPDFSLDTLKLTTSLAYLSFAEAIQAAWQELGIETNITVANAPPSDFQMLLIGREIPPDPDQYNLWHSTQQTTNTTHYQSPKIDKLLEDGRHTFDQQERKKIYQDFQRFLIEDCPAAFLFHHKTYTVKRK